MMPEPPTELRDYLQQKDGAARWSELRARGAFRFLSFTSQVWQDLEWRHTIALCRPKLVLHPDVSVLYITGGAVNPLDLAELKLLSDATGMRAAMLFDVPNQPLFDLIEDDLIAHTFVRFLETGDASWPLLFPMAKATIRAMDAIQEAAPGIERFVLTGASKRGWTAWMAAATGDERIAGVAPMVFDNLNTAEQMRHQIETWGQYSEMIEPYTARGLQARLPTPEGAHLATIVDPYSYRRELTMPKLIVNGANDPYWTVDALSLYWDGLPGPKWALVVPNAGHLLGDKRLALETIAAFCRSVAGEFELPKLKFALEAGSARAEVCGLAPVRTVLWMAHSEDGDFRQSLWSPAAFRSDGSPMTFDVASAFTAALIEAQFKQGTGAFSLTSVAKVFPSP